MENKTCKKAGVQIQKLSDLPRLVAFTGALDFEFAFL